MSDPIVVRQAVRSPWWQVLESSYTYDEVLVLCNHEYGNFVAPLVKRCIAHEQTIAGLLVENERLRTLCDEKLPVFCPLCGKVVVEEERE